MSEMNPWFDTVPGPRLHDLIAKHGANLKQRYYTDDVYFAVWMHAVNKAVQRRIHMHFDDLEDWDYRDAYDDGCMPVDVAVVMLEDQGYAGAFE